MSGQTYKTSRACIRPATANQRFVYALDSVNPETVLSRILRDFMEGMGYSEMFPNFDKLRVGTVHPFSILLAQEVLEQPKSVNVFPSITVCDSNTSEDIQTLADQYNALVFHAKEVAILDGYRQNKEVFVSDTGWAKIQSTIASVGKIVGIQRSYNTRSTIDFNIWSENKDITSFLFDMVGHFLIQKKVDIHMENKIDIGQLNGRRSGDINLDFGMLLYGANVQVSVVMNHVAVLFDTAIGSVQEIDTSSLPEFFDMGGV